jgi:hypothetical protein
MADLATIDDHPNKLACGPRRLPSARMQVGVVVARLLHPPDLPGLTACFRLFLRNIHELDVTEFDGFVARLDVVFAER